MRLVSGRPPGARAISRVLLAVTSAAMAAGVMAGGVMASAAPAYGATAAAHPAPHHKTVITFTARRAAGPDTILPCVTKPGTAAKPAVTGGGCEPQTITCFLTEQTPSFVSIDNLVVGQANTECDHPVTAIRMSETILRSGVPAATGSGSSDQNDHAFSQALAACQPGVYVDSSQSFVTFPDGYVITAGMNPLHQSSQALDVPSCSPPGGGGGGGGGGCIAHAPATASHPAGRRPHLITC